MSDQAPKPAEGQCAFFLPKKKRFCRFRPNQGQTYCPEHACVLGVALERKRIVCPLNPKHTCYEDNLDKHLKKCNSRKRRTEEYYEEGINAGSDEEEGDVNTQTAVKATDTERLKHMIEKVNRLYEEFISSVEEDVRSHDCLREEMSNPYFGLSALRHRRQQASLIGQLEGLGLLAPGHCYVEMGAGKGQLSHWVRQAVSGHDDAAFLLVDRSSIRYKVDGYHKEEEKVKFERIKMDIQHLCLGKVPMVASSQRPLVAMGKHLCGAATDLTLRCLMETLSGTSSIASPSQPCPKRPRIDKTPAAAPTDCAETISTQRLSTNSPDKGKAEGAFVNRCHDANSATELLVNCGREGKKGVISEREEVKDDGEDSGEKMSSGGCDGERSIGQEELGSEVCLGKEVAVDKRVAGVVIALCCHHQCSWRAYVGKAFMRQCGIPPADFHLLTRLTSWAVCGWRDRDGSLGTKEKELTSIVEKDSKRRHSATELSGKSASSEKVDDDNDDKVDEKEDEGGDEDKGDAEEEKEHNTEDLVSSAGKEDGLQLTEKQKETVGWRCKRLIDYGRACYLRDLGLCADLKIYIDPHQTPENVVLVATPLVPS